MVAIDQYNSKDRPSPFAGVVRFLASVRLRDILRLPLYLFRRTEAETLARDIRIAESVSAAAGVPASAVSAAPVRLTPALLLERLQPEVDVVDAMTAHVDQVTTEAHATLDRVEYDLSQMWDEIAPYMTPAKTGEKTT